MSRVFDHELGPDCARAEPHQHVGRNAGGPMIRWFAYETDMERLIREAVYAADYGLGRDGCPFCGGVSEHGPKCIALAFGATGEDPEEPLSFG